MLNLSHKGYCCESEGKVVRKEETESLNRHPDPRHAYPVEKISTILSLSRAVCKEMRDDER